MKAHEAKCVEMKRQGADHVAKQLAGKSVQEQLEYWDVRTKMLLAKQAASTATSSPSTPN